MVRASFRSSWPIASHDRLRVRWDQCNRLVGGTSVNGSVLEEQVKDKNSFPLSRAANVEKRDLAWLVDAIAHLWEIQSAADKTAFGSTETVAEAFGEI